jgi:glutamate-1-semialdehyde 2,1-aminomutase
MNQERLASLREKVFRAYVDKTPKSKQIYERACRSLLGGVCSSTRFFPPYPFHMTHGRGSKIYDVDGNEYIDCFLSAGPLILGHCHPEVMDAVRRELDRGLLVFNDDLVVECAELIKEIVPCAERVRFANTGTEATLFAVRIARAFTGKNKIIKFYGHYHGLDDQFCVGTSSVSNDATSAGVPKESLKNTVLLKFSDVEAVRRKIAEDKDIAGVILDPQMQAGGIWPASRDYLRELRQITEERGVVLIFDEVITGFRLAPGGAQEYFKVKPDLVALSKGLAGGAKLAAVAGREDVMSTVTPRGLAPSASTKKFALHGGTFVDSNIALAASIAALKVYKKLGGQGEYQKLFQRSEKLKAEIEGAFAEKGVPVHVNICGPSLKLFLTSLEPSFELYSGLDMTALDLFYISLIAEGIFLTNPALRSIFLSFAHTDEDMKKIINAINTSLGKYHLEDIL